MCWKARILLCWKALTLIFVFYLAFRRSKWWQQGRKLLRQSQWPSDPASLSERFLHDTIEIFIFASPKNVPGRKMVAKEMERTVALCSNCYFRFLVNFVVQFLQDTITDEGPAAKRKKWDKAQHFYLETKSKVMAPLIYFSFCQDRDDGITLPNARWKNVLWAVFSHLHFAQLQVIWFLFYHHLAAKELQQVLHFDHSKSPTRRGVQWLMLINF